MHAHDIAKALQYFRTAIARGLRHDHDFSVVQQAYQRMCGIFIDNHVDSAIFYGRHALDMATVIQNNLAIKESGGLLAELYQQQGRYDSAFHYQQKVIASTEDEIVKQKERIALSAYFNEKMKEQTLASDQIKQRSRFWLAGLVVTFLLVVLLAFVYRRRLKSGYDKKMKETEMRALRAQMNPHFIFNCLGSINRYIVKSDTRTASQYLTKFAKLIRLIPRQFCHRSHQPRFGITNAAPVPRHGATQI